MAAADQKCASGLGKPCVLIIVVAGIERFAYKGVASNLVTYLTDVVELSTSSAAKNVNSWCGLTSMLPLLGAFLSDSYWDRYTTIFASSVLYVLFFYAITGSGLISLMGAAGEMLISINKAVFASALFTSLYLISIAQGGYNPCLQAFGADQLEGDACRDMSPSGRSQQDSDENRRKFFHWWYLGICTGSLLGVTIMSYIQDNYGWGWGFAIPAFSMIVSTVFFAWGKRHYTGKRLINSKLDRPIKAFLQSIKKAFGGIFLRRKLRLPNNIDDHVDIELAREEEIKPLCMNDNKINRAAGGAAADTEIEEKLEDQQVLVPLWLLWRLLPMWVTVLMFAVIFQQPATFFTKQGMSMKRNIGKSFESPPATLQSAITLSIILLMPLYDKLIIPALRLITGEEKGITVMQRMGIGMCLSVVAMAVAAVVERKRLELSSRDNPRQLSIFCLLPQYIILGISDVFTVVGMQEFFYTQVPASMRSVGFGLYLSVFGVGSFLSALLITIIEIVTKTAFGKNTSWFADDMTEARLDNYYWLLALLSAISFLMFASLAKYYSRMTILEN